METLIILTLTGISFLLSALLVNETKHTRCLMRELSKQDNQIKPRNVTRSVIRSINGVPRSEWSVK
jgi:hypothetical protein